METGVFYGLVWYVSATVTEMRAGRERERDENTWWFIWMSKYFAHHEMTVSLRIMGIGAEELKYFT